jgi:hypothetical protein
MTYISAINEHQDYRDVSNRNVRAGMYLCSIHLKLPSVTRVLSMCSFPAQSEVSFILSQHFLVLFVY